MGTRHLAEFHMLEPEMAFADMGDAMDNAEALLKSVLGCVLSSPDLMEDMNFFQKFYSEGLIARLESMVEKPFARVSYRDAIELLQEEIAKDPTKWQFPEVE